MATSSKVPRKSHKRTGSVVILFLVPFSSSVRDRLGKALRSLVFETALGALVTVEHGEDQSIAYTVDLADDHHFLVPYEICPNAIGLAFCLTNKGLVNISFSSVYHRSQKTSWIDQLIRERQSLKANINSVEKCFQINRLIHELNKYPIEFTRKLTALYNDMNMRMSTIEVPFSRPQDLYDKIQACRSVHSQRRLFCINPVDTERQPTLLGLQEAATKLYSKLFNSSKTNGKKCITKENGYLEDLLEHSFIIVGQPSSPECVAATKYEKFGDAYVAKLNVRILCLLDADKIQDHLTFSSIGVTLYPLDRQPGEQGEVQSPLEWKTRRISDATGLSKLFYYAELHSIRLTKSDLRNSRPLNSSKLCRLQFELRIRINNLKVEQELTFVSQPFGLCSHAQYFPEYVAKVLIYEIQQAPQTTEQMILPHVLANFICLYHMRVVGVEAKLHTRQFILRELQTAYETGAKKLSSTSNYVYEEILAKLISQMEFFVDHPFLSLMYHDNLFLGICDSNIDQTLSGSREQPQILLRFNNLTEHRSTQQASVRYIVHTDQLTRATFHTKAFVDEMCRMVCEANSESAKTSRLLSDVPNRSLHDFTFYFNEELFRLNPMASPTKEAYKPLVPVLWSTMRTTNEDQSKQRPYSSLSNHQLNTLSESAASPDRCLSDVTVTTDQFLHYLADKLPEMLTKLQIENSSTTSALPPVSPAELLEKKKLFLFNLLNSYLQSMPQVQAASTQVIEKKNCAQPYTFFCSTSTNT